MKICKFGILVLAVGLIISQALAADVVVISSSKTVAQGQTFNLNVSIDPKGAAIAGAQLDIKFNKSIININGITEGNLFKQNGAKTFFNSGTINNSGGTVENIFAAILGPFNVSSPGVFITINATAIGSSGTSLLDLSNVKISDTNGNAIKPKVINGRIRIRVSSSGDGSGKRGK